MSVWANICLRITMIVLPPVAVCGLFVVEMYRIFLAFDFNVCLIITFNTSKCTVRNSWATVGNISSELMTIFCSPAPERVSWLGLCHWLSSAGCTAHSGLHIPDIAHIPPTFLTYHTLTHTQFRASHWSLGVTQASDWSLASLWAALHITISATPAEIEQAAADTPPLTYLKIFQNILKPFIVTGTAESPDGRNGPPGQLSLPSDVKMIYF